MSGHSKWSTIKHGKAATDARRGKLFTRLAREIIAAASQGGGDPEANFRLRMAVQRAKDNNMPAQNIERAIKRATGEGADGVQLVEATYEGYGPGGTAILLQALTDNRNRTVSEVRSTFTKGGGNLSESGSVAWQFPAARRHHRRDRRGAGRRSGPRLHRRRRRGLRDLRLRAERLLTPGVARTPPQHSRRGGRYHQDLGAVDGGDQHRAPRREVPP